MISDTRYDVIVPLGARWPVYDEALKATWVGAQTQLVLDAAAGNVDGDLHKPAPIQAFEEVGRAPGALRVAVSTAFPFNFFRSTLHPEIAAALQDVADQLGQLGHSVHRADPDYGLRMSWNFLSRSTAGLLDWSHRLGSDVELDPRTEGNIRTGWLLSQHTLRKARAAEAAARRALARQTASANSTAEGTCRAPGVGTYIRGS